MKRLKVESMIDRFEAVRDKAVPYKEIQVSVDLANNYMPPSATPGVPLLLKNQGARTVAKLTVNDSLTDNRLHLDAITASNLGFQREGEKQTVDLRPAPVTKADELIVQNAVPLPDEVDKGSLNFEQISQEIYELFYGKFCATGDETVVPSGDLSFEMPVVVTDYTPRNSPDEVAFVDENTQVTFAMLDPEAGGQSGIFPATGEIQQPPHQEQQMQPYNPQNMSNANVENNPPQNEQFEEQVTFDSIGGLDDEIHRVREIVERPLTDPHAFQGVSLPSGVLLYGPPGTGKTMLAKAVANESNAAFYSISGSEIFDKNYGESERNLRELFEEAKQRQPAIIFIDELEALVPPREDLQGGNQVERRVVTQLKTLMDGFSSDDRVIVLGATNHPDEIDNAFLRPGRFDRLVEIGVPDHGERKEIFQIHTRDMHLKFDDDYLDTLVEKTVGYTGADISDLCTKANMHMQRRLLDEYSRYTGEQRVSAILKNENEGYQPEDFENALQEKTPSMLKKHDIDIPEVSWSDIGGHDGVKQRLRGHVDGPLKAPELWGEEERSTGILLHGPPGTGKTMLAKAMATESDRVFIGVQATQLKSKWVGETERNIRDIFSLAQSLEPSILYIDEIEAIAQPRGQSAGDAGVGDAATSQLLSELDGIEDRGDVIVVGSTNAQYNPEKPLQRQNVQWGLDPALLRPGRLATHEYIPNPDKDAREEIFHIHLDKVSASDNVAVEEVDVEELAEKTDGVSGADIEGICWEAKTSARQRVIDAVGGLDDLDGDETVTITHDNLLTALDSFTAQAETAVGRTFQ